MSGSFKTAAPAGHRWPLFRSFEGWRPVNLGADAIAGLTLAAIAIPEQMATARLAGFAPEIGFLALLAGAVGFAIFGDSRRMSIGADSTIAPIFAGALAGLAAAGSTHYAAAAGVLALAVGTILVLGGVFRLGFIADLLSIPVTTGFLAGIAGHILVSQAPSLLGLQEPQGSLFWQAYSLLRQIGSANRWTLAIGVGMLVVTIISEKVSPRIPGALIGLVVATFATVALGLEARGVETLGEITGATLRLSLPSVSPHDLSLIATLAVPITLIVMVQTAATTRAFSEKQVEPDVNRDFIGVGVSNALAGLTGSFPVDASPPRTAVIAETGGVSQLSGLICAAIALGVLAVGGQALAHVPRAALAGVLLFIALRIVRVSAMIDVWRRSKVEFLLIVATTLAILILPIQQGVSVGIIASLLHGVWTTTRAQAVELQRIPATSIWWPPQPDFKGETVPGTRVIALQAPVSFLNAYDFRTILDRFADGQEQIKLIVIEASALVEIDYTGATVLGDLVRNLRGRGIDVAFARLGSIRAQQGFVKLGLTELIGQDHIFHSVQEAVDKLAH